MDAFEELLAFLRARCPAFAEALRRVPRPLTAATLPSLGFSMGPDDLDRYPGPVEQPWAIYSSGGTGGQPKVIKYLEEDWRHAIDVSAKALKLCGVSHGDVCLDLQPFGTWSIGQHFHEAALRINATSVPMGIHLPPQSIGALARAVRPTVLFGPPRRLLELGREPDLVWLSREGTIRRVVTAGARLAPALRRDLQDLWQAPAFSVYGSAETDTLVAECKEMNGHHVFASHFLYEIAERGCLESLPAGVEGDLLITALYRRGRPILRYRLGDRVRLIGHECPCGDPGPLIEILGRDDGSVTLGDGTTLAPFQVNAALDVVGEPFLDCQVTVRRLDRESVDIRLKPSRPPSSAEVRRAQTFGQHLGLDFSDGLAAGAFICQVTILQADADLEPTDRGKYRAIIDLRGDGA